MEDQLVEGHGAVNLGNRMMSANPWKVLQEEIKFSCPYFDVRRDLVSHAGQPPQDYNSIRVKYIGVSILPVDEHGLVTLVASTGMSSGAISGAAGRRLPHSAVLLEDNAIADMRHEHEDRPNYKT